MPGNHRDAKLPTLAQDRATRGLVNHLKGLAAEESVVATYLSRGCELLTRRWRGQAGEIDLIFSTGRTIVFVEVKASRSFSAAASHLSNRQIAVISRAIDEYLAEMPAGNLTDIRFDLAMVDQQGCVDVLENVLAG